MLMNVKISLKQKMQNLDLLNVEKRKILETSIYKHEISQVYNLKYNYVHCGF